MKRNKWEYRNYIETKQIKTVFGLKHKVLEVFSIYIVNICVTIY